MEISIKHKLLFRIIVVLLFVALGACGTGATATPSPTRTSAPTTIPATAIATSIWDTLLNSTPYPHELPLPEAAASSIDGIYGKVDLSPPQWWTCYRCADYRPAGGIWKMQFDKGVMRIYYEVTNWKSIASFTVSGNRLKIFNDPFCPHDIVEYEWKMENGKLALSVISDSCAFDLRGENLSAQSWLACSAGGQDLQGCAEIPNAPEGETLLSLPVTVTAHGGDSHYFEQPPDLFAAPNKENVPSPQGIRIQYHDDSIPYGTHRVLWWKGDWIEARTDLPFTSIGVQFWGSGYLGWARVLFDDVEVWRGLTTALGREYAYYGGDIEFADFTPGAHTIRVENLGFDYHPIKVAAFGFSNQNVQKKVP